MAVQYVTLQRDPLKLICQGDWILPNIEKIKISFKKIIWPKANLIQIDGANIRKMDSAGAWLLHEWIILLKEKGFKPELIHFSKEQEKIISLVEKQTVSQKDLPRIIIPFWLARLGKNSLQQLGELRDYLSFTGELTMEVLRCAFTPAKWRWTPLAATIEKSGYQALPIIALLSFMIGVVITYQTGLKLQTYGANIFIVDLIGFAVLREFGPLLTAIMLAGRTGSAFTAELGIMKINQEIDALNTMGITPAELLILPRIFGLLIALPLLTIWADVFGVLGGMMMAQNMFGITWHDFLARFQHEVPLRALIIGIAKAPVFALIIASIGCFEGIKVFGSADDVGRRTTRSVVLAIFFIIITDAVFSILFSMYKL